MAEPVTAEPAEHFAGLKKIRVHYWPEHLTRWVRRYDDDTGAQLTQFNH